MNLRNVPIRILFNDAHANLPESRHIPQGGPSRFAQLFSSYFESNHPDIELISVLFSHNADDKSIFMRKTIKNRHYFELVHPNQKLLASYKKSFSVTAYKTYLAPWLSVVDAIFEQAKPDLVFLNGFSLSNWMLLEIAHRRNIPVCIQHAGIWKKELQVAKEAFSSSIRKIFVHFEKEIIQKAAHQIFLNEFSRDAFFKAHRIGKTKQILSKTSIVPLPIDIPTTIRPLSLSQQNIYHIGVVARWDKIKNHSAVARFASYVQQAKLPFQISVVTKWSEKLVSDFKNTYVRLVHIVSPMDPKELVKFYRTCDIILIPSRFDVYPAVLMEALLQGTPAVISQNTGWVNDYRKIGLEALIFAPHASGKIIASKLRALIDGQKAYLPRFSRLQQHIVAEHAPKKVFSQYYKLFTQHAL